MHWFLSPLPILVFLLTAGVAGGVGYTYGHSSGKAVVQQQWDADKAAVAQAVADELTRIRRKEADLQANADKLRKDKDEALHAANARADALVKRLRDRPSRPIQAAGVPPDTGPAGAAEGCTGAQLYREDGEAYVGEARLANEVQEYLRMYYEAYKELREQQGARNENSSQRNK